MPMKGMDDGMASATGNQPAVDRECDGPGDEKGEYEAAPEQEAGGSSVHCTWDEQHDEVIHEFHNGNRSGVGGKCEAQG